MSTDGGGLGPEDFGLGGDFDEALAEATGEAGGGESEGNFSAPAVQDEPKPNKMDFSKLKMILDIPLKVTVELGRTKMLVSNRNRLFCQCYHF